MTARRSSPRPSAPAASACASGPEGSPPTPRTARCGGWCSRSRGDRTWPTSSRAGWRSSPSPGRWTIRASTPRGSASPTSWRGRSTSGSSRARTGCSPATTTPTRSGGCPSSSRRRRCGACGGTGGRRTDGTWPRPGWTSGGCGPGTSRTPRIPRRPRARCATRRPARRTPRCGCSCSTSAAASGSRSPGTGRPSRTSPGWSGTRRDPSRSSSRAATSVGCSCSRPTTGGGRRRSWQSWRTPSGSSSPRTRRGVWPTAGWSWWSPIGRPTRTASPWTASRSRPPASRCVRSSTWARGCCSARRRTRPRSTCGAGRRSGARSGSRTSPASMRGLRAVPSSS
ncbi:hypothetical protein HRbin12_01673 [bacterium HR12]|nr:hypothetical protein HRbin12_01673 [bacterium HR12]